MDNRPDDRIISMGATRLRRRTTAVVAALGLAAAACGGGEGDAAPTTAAPTTAAPTTAAPPPTEPPATAWPTEPPAPTTTESQEELCAGAGAGLAEERAVEAREIMAAGPSGLGLERLADLRGRAVLNSTARLFECTGGWTDDDETRYQAILAAAQPVEDDSESADETGGETADETAADAGGGDSLAAGQPPAEPAEQAPAGPAPDDPEWVDTQPTVPPLPPEDQQQAPVILSKAALRPIAEVRPYVCEHMPWWCGDAERWTWEPVRLGVGSRWSLPSTGEIDFSQEIPPGTGNFRVTFDAEYRYTVAGFELTPEPTAGGILDISVLVASERTGKWGWRFADGTTRDCIPDGAEGERCDYNRRDIAIRALVLPEHADSIERDGGTVTAATVLLLWAVPVPAGG